VAFLLRDFGGDEAGSCRYPAAGGITTTLARLASPVSPVLRTVSAVVVPGKHRSTLALVSMQSA